MRGCYENASFGSHVDRFFGEAWAFGCQEKCPRLAATGVANTLAVATSAIFICGGELEKVMGWPIPTSYSASGPACPN